MTEGGWRARHGELLRILTGHEERLATHPALAGHDEQADLARWLTTVLHIATQTNLWARPDRPRVVPITGPSLRWGGDNPDATYGHVALDHAHTYRVRARVGSAVYSSLTVYGGPRDGHYSTRIVGTVRPTDLAPDAEGWRSFVLGPGADLELDLDTEVGVTRDYYREVDGRVPTEWAIEVLDGPAGDDDLDAALLRTANWLDDQAAIVPVELEGNVVQAPYPVPEHTFGWAAGDAAYAMGAFDLGDGERLVLRGRSPACAFWNVCLWNPLLHSFDSTDGTPTSRHDGEIELDADGGWTIELGTGPGSGPNQLSSQGRPKGLIWFRWFLPDATPDPVTAEVVRRSS
ncbi:MAG: hypothetical protein M3Z03_00280 [Actinomycetota bacterium]|nr:hypothetical protein [Actinomycetota bacterium]